MKLSALFGEGDYMSARVLAELTNNIHLGEGGRFHLSRSIHGLRRISLREVSPLNGFLIHCHCRGARREDT